MQRELPDGHVVKYLHCRTYFNRITEMKQVMSKKDAERLEMGPPLPHGGFTVARILDGDGKMLAVDTAVCHELDNFNAKLGRRIALGRALHDLENR